MKYTLLTILFLALITGCSKEKFETKPHLKLLSVSDNVVPKNGTLDVNLEFNDKEGDVFDSLFVSKVRLNARTTATTRDSFRLKVPAFPNDKKGELAFTLNYQQHLISAQSPLTVPGTNNPVLFESDTVNIRFVLRDKAGNKSDTLVIDNVVVQR
jgi:hypothetical protein